MATTPENTKFTKYPDKDTTVEDNDNIKQEIKEEPIEDYAAYTLEENIDIALRDGHLGLAVDADFLHEDKRIKMEKEDHDNSRSCFETQQSLQQEYENIDTGNSNSGLVNNNVIVRAPACNQEVLRCSLCTFVYTKSATLRLHEIVHTKKKIKYYRCIECDYRATETGHFNRHVLTHHSDKPQQCTHCDKSYSAESELQNHIKTNHVESILRCDMCDFTTYLSTYLSKHAVKEHRPKKKKHPCPHCIDSFSNLGSLQAHLKLMQHPRSLLKCEICDYSTYLSTSMSKHIERHRLKKKKHQCPHCVSSFCHVLSLQPHLKTQHPESILRCNLCDYTTYLTASMSKHAGNHAEKQCPHCGNSFSYLGDLQTHIKSQHPESILRCDMCNFSTCLSTSMNKHTENHRSRRIIKSPNKLQCTHCFSSFSLLSNLQAHLRTKHPEAILRCNMCDYSTFIPSLMDKHTQQNHDEKVVISCTHEKCDFIATEASSLDVHRIVHFTEKPYLCSECEYFSSNTQNFNHHILTHFNDNPYQCSFCFKWYTFGGLTKHLKTKHAGSLLRCELCAYSTHLPTSMSKHAGKHRREKDKIHLSYVATETYSL